MPGLGHLYLGRRGRAAIWFAGYVVVTAIFWARDDLGSPAALVLVSAMSLIAAADAVVVARLGPG